MYIDLVKTPLHRHRTHIALTIEVSLRANLSTAAKLFNRAINNIHNILRADVEVDIAIDASSLDAELAAAVLDDLMLFLDGVLDLPLALRVLDIVDDAHAVADGRGRAAGLVRVRGGAAVLDRRLDEARPVRNRMVRF
jgi:hypothetical protein